MIFGMDRRAPYLILHVINDTYHMEVLTALGAASAVILLIFERYSWAASLSSAIQVVLNDIVVYGDWIDFLKIVGPM